MVPGYAGASMQTGMSVTAAAPTCPPTGTFNEALEKDALERLPECELSRFAGAGSLHVIPQSVKEEQLKKIHAELLLRPQASGQGFRLGSDPLSGSLAPRAVEKVAARDHVRKQARKLGIPLRESRQKMRIKNALEKDVRRVL